MTERPTPPPPLVVRARRVEGAPVVAVRVWIRGGSRVETIPGQALLAGRLLAEGTRRRDWRQIAEEAEARGVSIATTAGYEAQGISVDALASDWRRALEWAAELALEPAFAPERCAWIAEQTRSELASLADHPDVVADWAFRRQLYAPHPRGRPLQGTDDGLASIDADSCRAFHRQALGRGVIVSVAGALEPEAARRAAAELFAPVAALEPPTDPEAVPPIEGLGGRQEVPLAAAEQVHLLIGGLTVTRSDETLAALDLLAVVLGSGGGLIGRIPHRVREIEGLAYTCRAVTTAGAGLEPGRCEVYLATAPESAGRAEAVVREELERVVSGPLPERELEEARAFLLGGEPFRRETARQWATLMAEAAFYRLPLDRPRWVRARIREVGGAEVERAARRFLEPSRLKTTLAARG